MNGLDPLRVDPQLSEQQQFSKKLDWDELLGRLRTEAECEKLERKLQETEEELVKERKRILELENCLSDLQDSASLVSFSRVSEHSSASISSSYSSSPSDPFHSSNNNISNIFGNNSNQQLPPIRPPVGQAPPPPPPSARQLRSGNETLIISSNKSIPKKKVPISLCPVKTLNWTPIPKDKLKGTIWENLDEKNIYNQIDIEALSEQFAAGKSGTDEQQHSIEGNSFTLHRSLALRQANQITVIDSRRAQNCTIMLARLKMSHRDIRHTLLGMDERCKLSRDILEQMLKFKRKQHQSLALADRFLWEMGQVPRYEQRLKCLCTIRSFQDRCSEIRPGILAISRASDTLCNSKRLIQFLALILAVGNILNEGKRLGNCYDCVHLFGVSIESKRPNSEIILPHSDQFFGPFARCFSGLADCHRTVRTEREEIEAKKRQFQLKTLFNQRRKESGRASRDSSHLSVARVYKNGGKVGKADRDFEAIVNMLQTGELFSEELSRLRTSVRIKGPKTTTTIVTISK
uniref:FH2 domain-containing protein n=1 Tax=Meloidogyne javanica TaxID=6303 RepID=A0A915MEX6_MELJA